MPCLWWSIKTLQRADTYQFQLYMQKFKIHTVFETELNYKNPYYNKTQ